MLDPVSQRVFAIAFGYYEDHNDWAWLDILILSAARIAWHVNLAFIIPSHHVMLRAMVGRIYFFPRGDCSRFSLLLQEGIERGSIASMPFTK